ncbi:MAG: ketosteroid isomerase [Actinophytocola sp.]|uniref:nuclear transport factor 2 family protein n=1 Tax=Actinophytocola sp. TaxID=1872138 RepID=UPI00132893D9|nr:nuclear transport factor 2 family protein [Actinophytocola sp.]MPZ81639.1 ketosteroid isomerase [Actinophytocola sp.]
MSDTPREVAARLLQGITDGRWSELPDLYADDTVVEQPFSPPRPAVIRGKEEIAKHFAGSLTQQIRLRAHNVVTHETTDPEVVVVEYDYEVSAAGRTSTVHNIQVIRVRDGHIVASRDYHDHQAMLEALS